MTNQNRVFVFVIPYFSFNVNNEENEKKRKLLPVINQTSGKTENRFTEKIEDEDEKKSEDGNDEDVDDENEDDNNHVTKKDILEIQKESNDIWPKRLANVRFL